ncbi:hypothetical protein [Comamonas sp. 17RB]|uniref:hypothetical protein n=1 Tax=Comamonas sp. 17RB TaxID=3047025 RepID=UPI0024B7DFE2|nr:hypothetical protein [Comamonas sp. 17RB]MDI9853800.1 hypothetical protein [Comamonas sp. 17RB]
MQKYKSNITSTTGAAIRNVPVTVLNEAGELASLFLDRAGAIAAPNPLATDSSGNFYFYAVNGRYSLRTTVEGVTITDDDVVLLQDPVEITVAGPIAEAIAAAQAAARQAQDVVDSSGIPDMVAAAQNAVIDSNQALQEARGASLASAEAKQAAESAKSAAELAKGDAQAASSTANAAAQSAAQSAASIDPTAIYQAIGKKVDAQPNAGLMTDVERQKLGGIVGGATKVESRVIDCIDLKDFFTQCLALGSGFYRANEGAMPEELRYAHGYFSYSNTGTWSFTANAYSSAKPMFYAGLTADIAAGTWKQYTPMARANHTGVQAISTVDGLQTWMNAPSINSLNSGPLAGRRNKIHNGTMRVNQRGLTAVNPGPAGPDRWGYAGAHDGALAISVINVAADLASSGIVTAMRATVNTADTSIGASQAAFLTHRIEGYDISALIGNAWTFSCWVRTSFAGTYCLSFVNGGGDRSWVTAIGLLANTWTKVKVTLPGGLPTAGTWNYTNGVGMSISWGLAVGTALQTDTSNAWVTGNVIATAAQVNFLGATARTFDLTGVQLELGSVATPYEQISYAEELAICKRYYLNFSNTMTLVTSSAANANQKIFPVEMRQLPTVNQSTPSGTGALWVATSSRTFAQGGSHSIDAGTAVLEFNAEL